MRPLGEFEREQAILLDLESVGRVTVSELTERFGVSAVTVRKDLSALEHRDLLVRVRGGAVSAGTSDEGAWAMRVRHARRAKQAIARAAAEQVRHGDVVALDSSTTCYHLATELVDRRNLVVITNGLRVATLFMERTNFMVLLPGGVLRRSAESLVGPIGDLLTGRGRIHKGFFGLVGLSPEHGLMEISAEEAQTKAFIASVCDEVYGMFDASKADRFALHPFVRPQQVHALYTDDRISPEVVAGWAGVGVPVHRAPILGTEPLDPDDEDTE
ncbi:DeoR/GlpR family DNA-binding transcription regulator [Pseudonocardia spinosispora]|uniref:DeoR/GlpR family DNA-binding transcription regulator n=1 Tax=Pseudonocardia spinosispora TaxID=103441 RepID=UPI0003F96D36|nr:DeoR/GlpR family DNA-binding transcription regulator [Pseudonocardia spinosispora]